MAEGDAMTKAPKYFAYCLNCCGGGKDLTGPVTKASAATAAVGHMNAYHHEVTILEVK